MVLFWIWFCQKHATIKANNIEILEIKILKDHYKIINIQLQSRKTYKGTNRQGINLVSNLCRHENFEPPHEQAAHLV